MDGSSSAPDSEPESLEVAEGSSRSSEIERELSELRARAYGPQADIETDPAAMARLTELEAAQRTVTTTVHDDARGFGVAPDASTESPAATSTAVGPQASAEPAVQAMPIDASRTPKRSPWQRAKATPRRAWWFIAGAVVVVVLVVSAATWLLSPHPDASLRPTAVDENSTAFAVLYSEGWGPVASTLRQFEPYHGVVSWSVETRSGDLCLAAWDSTGSGRFEFQCAPPVTDQSVHMRAEDGFGEWLPEGSILSFHLRGNTVDVFVRPPPAAD